MEEMFFSENEFDDINLFDINVPMFPGALEGTDCLEIKGPERDYGKLLYSEVALSDVRGQVESTITSEVAAQNTPESSQDRELDKILEDHLNYFESKNVSIEGAVQSNVLLDTSYMETIETTALKDPTQWTVFDKEGEITAETNSFMKSGDGASESTAQSKVVVEFISPEIHTTENIAQEDFSSGSSFHMEGGLNLYCLESGDYCFEGAAQSEFLSENHTTEKAAQSELLSSENHTINSAPQSKLLSVNYTSESTTQGELLSENHTSESAARSKLLSTEDHTTESAAQSLSPSNVEGGILQVSGCCVPYQLPKNQRECDTIIDLTGDDDSSRVVEDEHMPNIQNNVRPSGVFDTNCAFLNSEEDYGYTVEMEINTSE